MEEQLAQCSYILGYAPSASTTSATLLLTRVDHPRSSEELLGHCTIGIALDTYSHILLDTQDLLTRDLEDALSCRVAVKGAAKRIPALSLVRRMRCTSRAPPGRPLHARRYLVPFLEGLVRLNAGTCGP
jgi:hypothetical protein